jgi:hypothetical protein
MASPHPDQPDDLSAAMGSDLSARTHRIAFAQRRHRHLLAVSRAEVS